LIKKVTTHQE